MKSNLTLEDLWQAADFNPNPNQKEAITHVSGPLYLPAGPGSGKTRVLLWRTLNLIVFHNVSPDEIYLATFTEKAALQLQEGLRALLGLATNETGVHYDLSSMYIGTVHSLCQHLITDRRFSSDHRRARVPVLLDDVDQYFFISRRRNWESLLDAVGWLADGETHRTINALFDTNSESKYRAIQHCTSLFNRFSEECIEPRQIWRRTQNRDLKRLIDMYDQYVKLLETAQAVPHTDFALVQQRAFDRLNSFAGSGQVFRYVIIDEYQDTNTIQERLYFKLAAGHKNLCVVGDDDQALYRFRGATVENFVEFAARCKQHLGCSPRVIPLAINYRSRQKIVAFYKDFITRCDWQKDGKSNQFYRVTDKDIQAHRQDKAPSVVVTSPGKPQDVFAEIAQLVRNLVDAGKVTDPNQIAFLFPSLKYQGKMTDQVQRMREALQEQGFQIYAPRAGRFLDVDEAVAMFGLFFQVLGKPKRSDEYDYGDYKNFFDWIDHAYEVASELMRADSLLKTYVWERRDEIKTVTSDYNTLTSVVQGRGWSLNDPYDLNRMKRTLYNASGLSDRAKRLLSNRYFDRVVERRIAEGQPPFTLKYVINRATSLDWNTLDLFYRFCGFSHFKAMFDLAEAGTDEGPVCNLSLISQQLARFVDSQIGLITAQMLDSDLFLRIFTMSYLYTLYRMGEAEYEDAEDPFPKGRIPFLTIHQSKGLEFPVVVLPNLRKKTTDPQLIEKIVRPLLDREGEPLERSPLFDAMRQFYVALSRAKNLLILGHLQSQGNWVNEPFKQMFKDGVTRIPDFDLSTVPEADEKDEDLPRNYSYTADYLLYQKCPRQYMLFRKYGFAPSATETMVFGSVIHRTLEDLHQYLISQRSRAT